MNTIELHTALTALVFTDLDGTLLDHHDYSCAPALPALKRLGDEGIPLIPTTSKTLAEMVVINQQLQNPHPFIIENGAAICLPMDYPIAVADAVVVENHRVVNLSDDYDNILSALHRLRVDGFPFRGFNDMTDAEVANATGLQLNEASRARRRLGTEPLIWQGTESDRIEFARRLSAHRLGMIRGGRFWHVTGKTDKAGAMQRLAAMYRSQGYSIGTIVALGDSANDEQMLSQADVAVVVKRHDGSHLASNGRQLTIRTAEPGPEGWGRAMLTLLEGPLRISEETHG